MIKEVRQFHALLKTVHSDLHSTGQRSDMFIFISVYFKYICYLLSWAQEFLAQDLNLNHYILLGNVEINSLERTEELRVISHRQGSGSWEDGDLPFSNFMAFSDIKFLKNALHLLL